MPNAVAPDYRFVKVDQTGMLVDSYRKEKGIASCGIFYLIDANLHVHICSLTPALEAWPMYAYVTYTSEAASEKDEGQAELDLMRDEEECSYFDTNVLQNPAQSAAKYVPAREEDESGETYRQRVATEVREQVCGNPVWF